MSGEIVAALFVESGGCYFGDSRIDAWDVGRDARKYEGRLPVVAHPPCQLWGAMAKVNFSRWGGDHNRPGNDGGCFSSALASVRRCGGVLEHPAKTKAFSVNAIPPPINRGWNQIGPDEWVCEVWQSAYGHRANKATWLFVKGKRPKELKWERLSGTHQIGGQDKRGKMKNKPTIRRKDASATPVEFREALIQIATQHAAERGRG